MPGDRTRTAISLRCHVSSHAEHADVSPALELLVVVCQMHTEQPEADVSANRITKLRAVPSATHAAIPDPWGEVGLNAEVLRPEPYTEA